MADDRSESKAEQRMKSLVCVSLRMCICVCVEAETNRARRATTPFAITLTDAN